MIPAKENKILLVDDNLLFLNIMVQAFKKTGWECHTASSAALALDKLKVGVPDIILSDYDMPGMNGIEFRQSLMKLDEWKDIPFVFLTSLSDKETIEQGLDLQAIDFIIKDTPINVIISKLNNILLTVNKQRELSTIEVQNAAKALNIKSIPQKTPQINGYKVDFCHHSYHDIPGGDFIDLIQVNERFTYIVLGDIMGKKWMAWYFTFGYLSYIRSAVRFAALSNDFSPASILNKVNNIICLDDILQDILSSLSLLMIDTQEGIIIYSGAGDLPLLHYTAEDDKLTEVKADGLLLGMFADTFYNEEKITLNKNDQLFIFTDGMIDAADNGNIKTDYQGFKQKLAPLLANGTKFGDIKERLFDMNPDIVVDDQSIINITKTS
ncbi:fused response regulator/phosphatase [Mucilaginibacter sp. JRF]|uniref:fused response regulator/phosphatase n=1 Tax=Mucilaginibacter sp. JRF TaxID=2780088 RepID=UPI00187FA0C0|nr:fused response regulator/phosphatase [Mucilaginibacter sp. JRF]MBE9586356.1 fused response regulator/phosphatase [Mucilaginibacter sp. JRF]